MNLRAMISWLISFGGLLLLSHPATAQDKVSMGLSSVSGLHSAMWVAEEKGLFRKYGIDAEVIVTGQGGTAGRCSLMTSRW
jgi:ABC-type nitrate/sulfonate/bicarbonate transport system substrate-binding protein